jgi:hypothetical protein
MDHVGIDVHNRESQIYILAEGGEVVERRIRTEPERFGAVLGTRSRARIVIEASTDSEWVARCLESPPGSPALGRTRMRPPSGVACGRASQEPRLSCDPP